MHRYRITCIVAAVFVLAGCGGRDAPDVVARAPSAAGGGGVAGGEPGRDASAASVDAGPDADGGVLVDVSGLVREPGVYRMPPGARVHEAIAAAGGARPHADLTNLNRAATLVDGQQVVVGSVAADDASSGAEVGAPGSRVSINTADVTALDALPGIGPVTAERIVADRTAAGPFASLEDLDRVSGIGPATIEALRDVATT